VERVFLAALGGLGISLLALYSILLLGLPWAKPVLVGTGVALTVFGSLVSLAASPPISRRGTAAARPSSVVNPSSIAFVVGLLASGLVAAAWFQLAQPR
jgi:hypothetical protein